MKRLVRIVLPLLVAIAALSLLTFRHALHAATGEADASDSYTVTIVFNQIEYMVATDRDTVGEVLRDNKIDIYPEDLIIPDLEHPLSQGLSIFVYQSQEVIVTNFEGEDFALRTRARTVGSLMDEIGFVPKEDERVIPADHEALRPGMHVYLVKKSHDIIERERPISFKTKFIQDNTQYYTYRSVTQPGKPGKRKQRIRYEYENGTLTQHTVLEDTVLEEPVTEIIAVGTLTPPGGTPIGTVKASYYGADFHGQRTASGETFNKDQFTAAHPRLPFGTFVKVTNATNGKSVVVRITDRGPYIAGRGIDLSEAAFEQISHLGAGVVTVNLETVAS